MLVASIALYEILRTGGHFCTFSAFSGQLDSSPAVPFNLGGRKPRRPEPLTVDLPLTGFRS